MLLIPDCYRLAATDAPRRGWIDNLARWASDAVLGSRIEADATLTVLGDYGREYEPIGTLVAYPDGAVEIGLTLPAVPPVAAIEAARDACDPPTAAELATRIGVGVRTVQRWLRVDPGTGEPDRRPRGADGLRLVRFLREQHRPARRLVR